MKFIKFDFPESIFTAEGKHNSFYEDALPSEQIKATGLFLPPVFPESDSGVKVVCAD